MKRLYNQYHAATTFDNNEANQIDQILSEAVNKIWNDVVVPNNLCPRDSQLLSIETVSCLFSEKILRQAMNERKEERKLIPKIKTN